MRKTLFALLVAVIGCVSMLLTSCKRDKPAEQALVSDSSAFNPWKLGVAFWTFHTFSLPEALTLIDSSGVDYVEAVTFFKSGAALKDSLIGQLSPAGLQKVKDMLAGHNLTVESMYIGGDKTIKSWKDQFEIAKFLGAKFVTTEPPLDMWDEIDSLAGQYRMKVAIHEHWKGVSKYWHPDSVLAAIKGHPNFGACADLGHWPKSGVNPVDAVKQLEGHIIAIHLKDIAEFNNMKIQDVPVGTGIVDFPAVFAELKRQHFDGPIYIERDAEDKPSNLPSVLKTVEYYNDQMKKVQ
ncbi:MAG TPA: sugar phosphate isomerase/epimerase family protein [Chryseolinea sp.]|nr:sugar phosphate isomerase/epimerase family protein [Chryseolinea sp.]